MQYTYFRMPNGKPYTEDDGRYAPIHLLAELGKTATPNEEGGVSWTGFNLEPLLVALRSASVVVDPDGSELNETDTWEIIWNACVEQLKSAAGQPVDPAKLLKKADRLAGAFFRGPQTGYVLVSSLSMADFPLTRVKIRGCTITMWTQASRFIKAANSG